MRRASPSFSVPLPPRSSSGEATLRGRRMAANPPRTPCYFDGACPRNQFGTKGPMKAAYVVDGAGIVREVDDLETPAGRIRSNNVAEYEALILLLNHLRKRDRELGARGRYMICGDSQLVVRQMSGEYRVAQPHLQILYAKATDLAAGLDVEVRWIRRDENPAGRLLEGRNRPDKKATREN
jgi:ribonuclease HI